MSTDELLEKLKTAFSGDLPGEAAHQRMAPLNRPISSQALKNVNDYKLSAVAIVFYPSVETIECVLIQRPFYEGAHSGQISFPGGKCDEQDPSTIDTAIRECYEEVGLQLNEEHYLGKLTDVFIPVSNFLVKPHVFFYPDQPFFLPDEREVAEILTFSLEKIPDEDCISTMEVRFPNGMIQRNIPCFLFGTKKVWGATALILNEIREILLRV